MLERQKANSTSDGTTQIVMVLDRSGSMESVREQTIEGFNRFLERQLRTADHPEQVYVSLAQFDSDYEVVYENEPLPTAPRLTWERYQPRWSTALLDAIGLSTNAMVSSMRELEESERPGRVIFVILTDGMENASHEFTPDAVRRLIAERERAGWSYIFLGANQDAILSADRYGIHADRALSVAGCPAGVSAAMDAAGDLVLGALACSNAPVRFSLEARHFQRDLGAAAGHRPPAARSEEDNARSEDVVREGDWA